MQIVKVPNPVLTTPSKPVPLRASSAEVARRAEQGSEEQVEKIVQFYDQSFFDLYFGWGARKHLGIHYGFHDGEHTKHYDAILNMNNALAKRAGIRNGMKVLDAGCGIGGSAIWLAKQFRASVIGVTLSKRQKQVAEKLAKKHKVSHLTQFFTLNYLHTGFPDSNFDVVWALESMSYAKDKSSFLAEAKRMLKPGGVLIIADAFLKKEDLTAEEKNLTKKWLKGWAIDNIAQINLFIYLLNKFKYADIKHEDVTQNILPSSKRAYRMAVVAYPFTKILELIHLRSHLQTQGIISTILQWTTLKMGIWGYFIVSAKK